MRFPLLVLFATFAAVTTSGQNLKNLTQLKDTPPDQLLPAMQFMASALNVDCTFCHVQGKMDADDKPAKKKARDMIAMTAALNKDHFEGRQEITCYTCHHGASHPSGLTPVQAPFAATALPAAPTAAAPPQPAAVDDILNRYISALGGEAAIRRITTRYMKGVIETGGQETPVEVFTRAPNQRLSVTHSKRATA